MVWGSFSLILFLYTTSWVLDEIHGHGMLMDPVNRGSAWRNGFETPVNYDDNANNCGGFAVQYVVNKGKCGLCGDNYANSRPRPNENGGYFGRGLIVENYTMGQEIIFDVLLTANHMGHFEFSVCPLKNSNDKEEEECFKKYPIQLQDGSYKYKIEKKNPGHFYVIGYLPEGLTCDRCVLRWHYTCGNNWGMCEDGKGRPGCGNQETFRTCSDIAIHDAIAEEKK